MDLISSLSPLTLTVASDYSFSTPTTRAQPGPVFEDQVQIATIPTAVQVEQLQNIHSSSFHAVVGEAIRSLRVAASRSKDPAEAAYLSGMADRFQRLEYAGQGNATPNTPSPAEAAR